MPSHSGYKWLVASDVECLAWDPHSEHSFVVCIDLILYLPFFFEIKFFL